MIAMSGGVDSAVAAYLTLQEGGACMGGTMKLLNHTVAENSCGSLSDIQSARMIAEQLGMEFRVFDMSDSFQQEVIAQFVQAYCSGKTPNPCILCNRSMKFDRLYSCAKDCGCERLATGHYARVVYDATRGKYRLLCALDQTKDQSYVLYNLTQEQLARTLFPLGELNKAQVREIARELGFCNAEKPDSQDICFVQSGCYADFIAEYTKREFPHGDFVDTDGNVLGEHRGIIRYTVGQRKGLGLALPHPMYVVRIDPDANQVVLGKEEELFAHALTAHRINLIEDDDMAQPRRLLAKARYRQPAQWATVVQTDDDTLKIVFDQPQRALTPGQSVVLYDGEAVIGGGEIE